MVRELKYPMRVAGTAPKKIAKKTSEKIFVPGAQKRIEPENLTCPQCAFLRPFAILRLKSSGAKNVSQVP